MNSEDELLRELGEAIYIAQKSKQIRPPSDRELQKKAREWLEKNRKEIANKLQSDERLHKIAYEQRDKQILVSTISDALTGSFTGMPITTIAALVAHYGIDHFLSDGEEPK